MKNRTPFFIGLFIFLIIGSCKYKEISPCEIDGIPHCCETGNVTPCCDDPSLIPASCNFTTFDSLIAISQLSNCAQPKIHEAIELPNGKGVLLVGQCGIAPTRQALIIHVDTAGNYGCHFPHSYNSATSDHIFHSVDLSSQGDVIVTGLSKTINSNVYTFLGNNSNDFCGEMDDNFVGDLTSSPVQWDEGFSIIGVDNDTVIVGGKEGLYPSLYKFENTSKFGAGELFDFAVYDIDDFESAIPSGDSMVAITGFNFCDIDNRVRGIYQTGDDGFLVTGTIIVKDIAGTKYIKAFLIKTAKAGNLNVLPSDGFIKIYDNNVSNFDLDINTVGTDVTEVIGGNKFIVAGFDYPQDYPQTDATCGADLSGKNFEGFILLVNNGNGEIEDRVSFDANNSGVRNSIRAITTKHNDDSELFAIGSISDGGTVKISVKHYKITSTSINPGNIEFNLDTPSNQRTTGEDILSTTDGGFFIVANVSDSNGNPEGIRIIKTNPEGKVFN